MSAVIELDSSDEDNEVVEVTETISEVEPEAGPNMCLNPMGHLAKSQGFIKEFVELLNMCFKFESSQGMERIITRNLIPNYKELNPEYTKSDNFKYFLRKMVKKLKNKPHMKFCCLKEVSENFKVNKMKKKVNFITLNTKASDKFKRHYNMQIEEKERNKKKTDNIIILDENEDPHPQFINLESEQNDVIDLENWDNPNNVAKKLNDENNGKTKLTNESESIEHTDNNKNIKHTAQKKNAMLNENQVSDCEENIGQSNGEHIKTNRTAGKKNNASEMQDSDIDENTETCDDEQIEKNLTVYKKNKAQINNIEDSDCEENMDQSDGETIEIDHSSNYNINLYENTAQNHAIDSLEKLSSIQTINNNYKSTLESVSFRDNLLNISHARDIEKPIEIKGLELEIKTLKDYLIRLEESEVVSDSLRSPYMEAHKTKLLIIKKYKHICQLRGETYKPSKCRQFQLQVKEGHPAGPARKLEEWLNTNIDKNGEPSFPNLRDVIMCVWVANQEDGLGWDINKTYQEARILFTQCGQHLQRRRQKREWRDLMQTAKTSVDHDPADSDPQLLEKLEANRQLARAKFDGIIDHYVKLEDECRKKSKPGRSIVITDVKSLSTPNPQPTWEVPITGVISEVPKPEMIRKLPITGIIIEEVPITGLVNLTPNALSNNHNETNIKIENIDKTVNIKQENSNQAVVKNEISNNMRELAFELYNSVLKENNRTSCQPDIDRGQAENNSSQNPQNSSENYQKPSLTKNTKTIEPNDVSNDNFNAKIFSNDDVKYESSSIVYGKHKVSKINVEPSIESDDNNDELSPEVDDNRLARGLPSQAKEHFNGPENMDTEDLTSQTKKLISVEKTKTDKVLQNITKENETNTVTVNTQMDKNSKSNAIDECNRINNNKNIINNNKDLTNDNKDLSSEPNDQTKIKCEVKMEVDFSEEDFDLLLDQNFSCDTMASARVFDVEDTVVIIELSSSESESDDDDCQLITL